MDNVYFNPTFDTILRMSDFDFKNWVNDMRSKVLNIWDEFGIPPLSGKTKDEIQKDFCEMESYPVGLFQQIDELDGKNNVILNTALSLGSCVNQFFPTMMKAKINYNTSLKDGDKFTGHAVYDLFADDKYKKTMQLGCRRHFRKDSFYRYSISIERGTKDGIVPCNTGEDWLNAFDKYPHLFDGYDFWLNAVDPIDKKGSGYTEVDANKFLYITKNQYYKVFADGYFDRQNVSNLPDKLKDDVQLHIRFYKKDIRIFPLGFTAFKIGYIQVAVNFPPLTAKFIYEKYTKHIKKQPIINIFDPSAGWGGRIIGAMSVRDRIINYIGTDPNTDNFITERNYSRYEYVAETFNKAVSINNLKKFLGETGQTYELFQECAEEIHNNKEFQKYRGKLDLVFTSPPYFNREGYSNDDTQSLVRYPKYEEWKNGFLYPTLKMCVEYLRSDRFLIWNISDIKVGKIYYPLEEDSKKILLDLGMEFVGIEKMCLMSMPGANRIGPDGKPTAKNFCKVDGKWRKYEPIFIFKKP
jgi:hypothetical protein